MTFFVQSSPTLRYVTKYCTSVGIFGIIQRQSVYFLGFSAFFLYLSESSGMGRCRRIYIGLTMRDSFPHGRHVLSSLGDSAYFSITQQPFTK